MKKWLPVLIMFAGLGSCLSFSQVVPSKDPFARYIAGVNSGLQEPAMLRFAADCRVNVSKIQPHYAVGPGSSFTAVKNLSKGMQRLDTDFYSTAEVWTSDDLVLVEIWANSDDVGSEVRYYKCFANRTLIKAEVIDWNLPLVMGSGIPAWGHSRQWEHGASGNMKRTKDEFVDEMEQPIPKPKLDADSEKSLHWIPPLGPLGELKLPSSTLR
ncbi:MAG: hypothetical protein ACLPY1_04140 [Terracidiphilus sp.]